MALTPEQAIQRWAAQNAANPADEQTIIRIETAIANSPIGRFQAMLGETENRASRDRAEAQDKVRDHDQEIESNRADAPEDAGAPPPPAASQPAVQPQVNQPNATAGGGEGGGRGGEGPGGAQHPRPRGPRGGAGGADAGGGADSLVASIAARPEGDVAAALDAYRPRQPETEQELSRIKQMGEIARGFNGQLDTYVNGSGGTLEGIFAGVVNFVGVGRDVNAVWTNNPYRQQQHMLSGLMTGLSAIKRVIQMVGNICGKIGLILTVVGLLGMIFPPIGAAVQGVARILNIVGIICDALAFIMGGVLVGLNGVVLAQQIARGGSAEEKAATADCLMSEAQDTAGSFLSIAMFFGPKFMKGLLGKSRGILGSLLRRAKGAVMSVVGGAAGRVKNFAQGIMRRLGIGAAMKVRMAQIGRRITGGWRSTAGEAAGQAARPGLVARMNQRLVDSGWAARLENIGARSGQVANRFEARIEGMGEAVGNIGQRSATAQRWTAMAEAREAANLAAQARYAGINAAELEGARTRQEAGRLRGEANARVDHPHAQVEYQMPRNERRDLLRGVNDFERGAGRRQVAAYGEGEAAAIAEQARLARLEQMATARGTNVSNLSAEERAFITRRAEAGVGGDLWRIRGIRKTTQAQRSDAENRGRGHNEFGRRQRQAALGAGGAGSSTLPVVQEILRRAQARAAQPSQPAPAQDPNAGAAPVSSSSSSSSSPNATTGPTAPAGPTAAPSAPPAGPTAAPASTSSSSSSEAPTEAPSGDGGGPPSEGGGDAGGGEPLPYWPALLGDADGSFGKALSELGMMRRVGAEFVRAQTKAKQQAYLAIEHYGALGEYSRRRQEAAQQTQNEAGQTGGEARGSEQNAGSADAQAGEGAGRQNEASSSANAPAPQLPEPESGSWWKRLLAAFKRWAKRKAQQIFGWIQEKIANVVLGGLCGVSMGDLRQYSAALRRSQQRAAGTADQAGVNAAQSAQQQGDTAQRADTEAAAAVNDAMECDRNITEAQQFLQQVTQMEQQVQQEQRAAQSFIQEITAEVQEERERAQAQNANPEAQEGQEEPSEEGGECEPPPGVDAQQLEPNASEPEPEQSVAPETASDVQEASSTVSNRAREASDQVSAEQQRQAQDLAASVPDQNGEPTGQAIVQGFRESMDGVIQTMSNIASQVISRETLQSISQEITQAAQAVDEEFRAAIEALERAFQAAYDRLGGGGGPQQSVPEEPEQPEHDVEEQPAPEPEPPMSTDPNAAAPEPNQSVEPNLSVAPPEQPLSSSPE